MAKHTESCKTWTKNGVVFMKRTNIDGSVEWFRDGLRHRKNGPALITSSGSKLWYRKGKLHREDGPAEKWADGFKRWWINGKIVKSTV